MLDQVRPKKLDPNRVYRNLMKVVKKKQTFENFQQNYRRNKALMKFIAEETEVASMNESEEAEFYSGLYKGVLFKRDGLE